MEQFRKRPVEDLPHVEASNMHPSESYFHFSFAHYYNPENMNFGVLRVLNDDAVKPHSGFGTHPHRDMEIFSYVVDGKLSHRDSAGNLEILSRGHAQSISAGTGLTHSELNEQNDWCRFLQIWILPERGNLPVRYDFHKFPPEDRENKLLHILSSAENRNQAPLYVCQDINIYVSELTEAGKRVSFELNKGRQAYIFCIEGSVDINQHHALGERDALEVIGETQIDFTLASEQAHCIIIEMQQEKPLQIV